MKWCGGAAVMIEMVTTAFGDGSNDVGGVGWRLMMMLGDDDGEMVCGVNDGQMPGISVVFQANASLGFLWTDTSLLLF
ncbi:hypothetical protein Tco_1160638 [Tanacetum coccineum]